MFLRADLAICAKMSGGEIKSAIHPQANNKNAHVWSVLAPLCRFDEYWFCLYKLRRRSIMRHRRPFTVSLLLLFTKRAAVAPSGKHFQSKPDVSNISNKTLHSPLPPPAAAHTSTSSWKKRFDTRHLFKRGFLQKENLPAERRRHSAAAGQSC